MDKTACKLKMKKSFFFLCIVFLLTSISKIIPMILKSHEVGWPLKIAEPCELSTQW